MTEEQITEAAGAVRVSTGTSAYLYGIDYSKDQFRQELDATVKHIKSHMKEPAMSTR